MTVAKFIGVYASSRAPGSRTRTPQSQRKRYWFVWDDGWGRYRVQLLDSAFQPVDSPRIITPQEFTANFVHQPHILVTPIRQLEVAAPEDDHHASHGPSAAHDDERDVRVDRTPSPEREEHDDIFATSAPAREQKPAPTLEQKPTSFPSPLAREDEVAAQIDRELRAEFSDGMDLLRKGEREKSLRIFKKMLRAREGIVPAHKHMYTDFAINLRKNALHEMARDHYKRAVELAPEDCNAHLNLARIYMEMGDLANAKLHVNKSLELSPDFAYAQKFSMYLENLLKRRPRGYSR